MSSDSIPQPGGPSAANGPIPQRPRRDATPSPADRVTDPQLVRLGIMVGSKAVNAALRALAVAASVAAAVGAIAGAVVAFILVNRDAITWWVALIPLVLWLAVAIWVVVRLWRMTGATSDVEAFGGQFMEALDVEWARERVYTALGTVAPAAGERRPGPLRTVMAWYRATRLPLQTLDKVRSLPLLRLFAPKALRHTLWMVWVWLFLVFAAPMATMGLAAFT